MNDVIINPMWFYMLELVYNLQFVFIVATLGATGACLFFLMTYIDDNRCTRYRKLYQRYGIMAIIMLIIVMLIPSKDTALQMIIAKKYNI